ncbi:unnamed protein product [Calypogeia fissa]
MNCLQSVGSSTGRATQCASGSTTDALDDEDDFGGNYSRPPKFIGAPLITEATSKVDKCLARLQSLQGTVTVPKVHVSSSASANLSPIFSRSKSCLHGSPKVHESNKIRIHDVLRWSDDFSGKYKQERREKYMRRLSHSKTEVFDDKKDPLDPHGEWKHWSSPAGDVHKVISEILMASQIAKQITSMVSAAIVHSDVSSDEGKRNRRATKDTATSPNPMTNPAMQQKIKKGDPLHKFRVAVSSDCPAKKRTTSVNRKEVLYPKSKQPIPDRSRLEGDNEVTLSTAKKMQSRRSPREAVKEVRPQEDLWSAKDITNSKSQQPPVEVRGAKDITNSKYHQNQADLGAAQDIPNRKYHQFQANVGAVKDITDVNQSHAELMAAKEKISKSKYQHPQLDMWAAKEITNSSKSNQPQPANWAARDVTNSRSQTRGAPVPETKKVVVPVIQKQAPYTVRRVRSSKSPPRTLVAKPQLSNASSKSLKPSFTVKQGSKGPQPRVATSSTTTARAEAPISEIKPTRQPLPADTTFLSFRAKQSVDVKVETAPPSPSSSVTTLEIQMCDPCPSALPVKILVLSPRPKGSVDTKQVHATLAASPGIKKSNPCPDELFEPALEGFNILRSSIPESRTCSGATSPQVKTPVKGSSYLPGQTNPLIGSLRHKFVMEATEIKGPSKPWQLNRSRSGKAVLFSNPAFAPASPNGARPSSEKQHRPVSGSPPKSPVRSISATRRVMDRIGRAISAGRRSISPDITRRLNSTRQKLAYLSPGKSLPSLISKLPSRGKRKPSPVPRATIVKSNSCARPAPQSKELPLPPGRKSLQQSVPAAAQQARERKIGHGLGSPAAASTDSSSYFSLRMLKELNSNAQQFPFKHPKGSKGTTPDIAPRASSSGSINAKQLKCHTSLDWEKEVGVVGVLSSCRKWVEESAPPLPGGYCKFEKENVEPVPQKILIKENVVASGWDDELVAPPILSTSRSRKVEENCVRHSRGGGSCTTPGELKSSFQGVRRSFSTGRIRSGASFLKRARDWVRTQTPNRMRSHTPNWDQPRRSGLVI